MAAQTSVHSLAAAQAADAVERRRQTWLAVMAALLVGLSLGLLAGR